MWQDSQAVYYIYFLRQWSITEISKTIEETNFKEYQMLFWGYYYINFV